MFDIIIPVFNEENRLPATLRLVAAYAEKARREPARMQVGKIIIVDDFSTDGTRELMRACAEKDPSIVCLQSAFKGKGAAIKTGMLESRADYTLFTDADLSTPMECVDDLLAVVAGAVMGTVSPGDRASIAIGSRHMKGSIVSGQNGLRRIMSWGVNVLDRLIVGNNVRDSQCGFKLFDRMSREIIFPRQTLNGFGFDMELLAIARVHGLAVREVPVRWVRHNDSRIRAVRDSVNMFRDMIHIHRNLKNGAYNP